MVKRDSEGHILLGAVDTVETTQPSQVAVDARAQEKADRRTIAALQTELARLQGLEQQRRQDQADADRLAQADADRLAQADADRLAQADADTAADADVEQTREAELHHG